MALTPGMFERFKTFASETEGQLLKIDMGKQGYIYGYLREAGSDFFVIQEVKKDTNGAIKLLSKTTHNPTSIVNYAEISPDMLPEPFIF